MWVAEKLNQAARNLYLTIAAAEEYPEQEPHHAYAKWHDLLWFIIPIVGFVLFYAGVRARALGDPDFVNR